MPASVYEQTARVNLVGINNQYAGRVFVMQNPNDRENWQDIIFYVPEALASAAYTRREGDVPEPTPTPTPTPTSPPTTPPPSTPPRTSVFKEMLSSVFVQKNKQERLCTTPAFEYD